METFLAAAIPALGLTCTAAILMFRAAFRKGN